MSHETNEHEFGAIATIITSFIESTSSSLHPGIEIKVPSSLLNRPSAFPSSSSPASLCIQHPKDNVVNDQDFLKPELHLFVEFNDRLFIDVYELADQWGPSSSASVLSENGPAEGAHMYWTIYPEVPDLERPVKYGFRAGLSPKQAQKHQEDILEEDNNGNKTNNIDIDTDTDTESILHVVFAPGSQRITTTDENTKNKNAQKGFIHLQLPLHARYQEPINAVVDSAGREETEGRRGKEGRYGSVKIGRDVNVTAVWAFSHASESQPPRMDQGEWLEEHGRVTMTTIHPPPLLPPGASFGGLTPG